MCENPFSLTMHFSTCLKPSMLAIGNLDKKRWSNLRTTGWLLCMTLVDSILDQIRFKNNRIFDCSLSIPVKIFSSEVLPEYNELTKQDYLNFKMGLLYYLSVGTNCKNQILVIPVWEVESVVTIPGGTIQLS